MDIYNSIYTLIDSFIPKYIIENKNQDEVKSECVDDYICIEDWGKVIVHVSDNKTVYNLDILDVYNHIIHFYINAYHIQKQFILDLSRSRVFFNHKQIHNIVKLDDYLIYKLKDLYVPFITLCTQSIFAIIIQNVYSNLDRKLVNSLPFNFISHKL